MKKKGKNVFDDFAQTFEGLKSSSESKNDADNSIDKKSIERIKEKPISTNLEENTVDQKTIAQSSLDNLSIDQKTEERQASGIHSTSVRVVKEELLKALAGLASRELKIGDIAPLTGLTRRTVDRVCKHLEKCGDFKFERQHRGVKVTNLRP